MDFKYEGIIHLTELIEKDLLLPVKFDCGPIIHPNESSTLEEKPKMSENLITMKLKRMWQSMRRKLIYTFPI